MWHWGTTKRGNTAYMYMNNVELIPKEKPTTYTGRNRNEGNTYHTGYTRSILRSTNTPVLQLYYHFRSYRTKMVIEDEYAIFYG